MAKEVKVFEFRGTRHTLNKRTVAMLTEVERQLGRRLTVVQGSYTSDVDASADTHDGGGAVDLRAKDVGPSQRARAVLVLRRVGFAAWLRTPDDGMELHIHAIAIGDKDLSPGAGRQVTAYKNKRNGLVGNSSGPDTGPGGFRAMTWERFLSTRRISDATVESSEKQKRDDNHLSIRAVRKAARGEPISHKFEFDAMQFMAVALKGIRVIPDTTFSAWHRTRDKTFFEFTVRRVQAHFGLRQDGDPGPVTLGKFERFGYIVTD